MGSSVNRITYLEPNNLPKEFAAKAANGVVLDNITWNPEDLNISVDLQVIIPSRKYRKSDTVTDYNEALLNRQSILSGVILDPKKSGDTFLTTDYTNISYQEIKNNNAGSKEMLGINSIHITFDSHLYPRVTMNFTDVRGASLMMPQEQYVYDMGVNKITGKDNPVCQNFFQSFFKFPYPQFLLSVKGVYGTCVTFVLSVEDFKATFNSESGNFDVVVTFIGLMYGLYTDIPMNYLIMAPYIGSSNGLVANEYWRSNAQIDGNFSFSEGDGTGNQPICTFFEFVHNYEDLLSAEQGVHGFTNMPNLVMMNNINKEITALKKLRDYFYDIKNNLVQGKDKNIICYEIYANEKHFLFLVSNDAICEVKFNEVFVKNFSDGLKSYENYFSSLNVGETDVPGKLSHYYESIKASYDYDGIFIKVSESDYKFNTNSNLYKLLSGDADTINEIQKQVVTDELCSAKSCIYYTDDFVKKIENRIEGLKLQSDSIEESASEEMIELFKNSCGFTPTVENVMRMIFAHMDTFLHKFYGVLESIGNKERIFGKNIKWDKDYTDVLSSSSNPELPPFAAFYKKKKNNLERVYPSPELKNIDEVQFVEEILNGLTNRLKEEAEIAKRRLESGSTSSSSSPSRNFTPISITDYFYDSSPYSDINVSDIHSISIYEVLYFIYCRIYIGARDFEKDKDKEIIINTELENFMNSNLWSYMQSNRDEFIKSKEVFREWLKQNSGKLPIFDVTLKRKSFKLLKNKDGKDFFKFKGLKDLRDGDHTTSRDDLTYRFDYNLIKTSDEVENFVQYCGNFLTDKDYKKTRIDDSKSFLRRDLFDTGHSILQPLIDGIPIIEVTDKDGKKEYHKKPDNDNKSPIRLQNEKSIYAGENETNLSLEELYGRDASSVWVPVIIDLDLKRKTNDKDLKNILRPYDKNVLFNDKIDNTIKGAWFLCKLINYEDIIRYNHFDFEHDHIFHVQNTILYAIGAYLSLDDVTQTEENKKILNEIKDYIKQFCPSFLTKSDKDNLKRNYVAWFSNVFKGTSDNPGILSLIVSGGSEEVKYKVKTYGGKEIDAASPGTELQKMLIELINENSFVISLPDSIEKKNKKELYTFPDETVNSIYYDIDKDLKYYTENSVEESKSITNVPINGSDENLKNSLYYTLKNLYDRWISVYSENNFKLEKPGIKRKPGSKSYSEFSNFLYVDSFYNDISKDFMMNPKLLFNLVNEQIAGNTNFNVLEFIGKLCQDNKLLFRCLPVYDNIYSAETFKEIFRPLSLYNGADKLHRRIGNTYLIMYPYEPSNKLNILQDKTNDVSYTNDSFNFADSFGNITDEATNLYGDGDGTNICAFGVTPGAQNQSYFTRVSVGMDNPRVTDYSIMNKFLLANGNGGTPKTEGTGQDMHSIYSNRSYDCNVEMLGCANIMPMMYFQLNNVPMFNGAYMITKVEHNIQNNTMTTKFTGTRMSRYYIPYNKSLFILEDLKDYINNLPDEQTNSLIKVGKNKIVIKSDSSLSINPAVSVSNEFIPQPSIKTAIKKFNVWSAVYQMGQQLYKVKDDSSSVPLISGSRGICATAVEMYLMAGFFGTFGANNKEQSKEIDEYRSKKSINGSIFKGYDGYDMRNQLAKLGFICIACGAEKMDEMAKNGEFQSGDVCCMAYKDKTKVGHVCMYSGTMWVSDFCQAGWRETSGFDKITHERVSNVDTSKEYNVLLYRHPDRENTPRVYCYYNKQTGIRVDTYLENDGYIDDVSKVEDMFVFSNLIES